MGDLVIVGVRPKPGCEASLLDLVHEHVPTLRRLGLASARPALAMRSRDGVVLEAFEWDDGAMAAAHAHPDVLAMWTRFATVCDDVPPANPVAHARGARVFSVSTSTSQACASAAIRVLPSFFATATTKLNSAISRAVIFAQPCWP